MMSLSISVHPSIVVMFLAGLHRACAQSHSISHTTHPHHCNAPLGTDSSTAAIATSYCTLI